MMNLINLDDTLSEVLINTLGLKNLVQVRTIYNIDRYLQMGYKRYNKP